MTMTCESQGTGHSGCNARAMDGFLCDRMLTEWDYGSTSERLEKSRYTLRPEVWSGLMCIGATTVLRSVDSSAEDCEGGSV